jgi:hypothetical protein
MSLVGVAGVSDSPALAAGFVGIKCTSLSSDGYRLAGCTGKTGGRGYFEDGPMTGSGPDYIRWANGDLTDDFLGGPESGSKGACGANSTPLRQRQTQTLYDNTGSAPVDGFGNIWFCWNMTKGTVHLQKGTVVKIG